MQKLWFRWVRRNRDCAASGVLRGGAAGAALRVRHRAEGDGHVRGGSGIAPGGYALGTLPGTLCIGNLLERL